MADTSEPTTSQTPETLFNRLSLGYESDRNRAFYMKMARLLLTDGLSERFHNSTAPLQCLDLACGTGLLTEVGTQALPEAGWTGLDISYEMLNLARAKASLSDVQFVRSSAERIPFDSESFDGVFCNIAYHWLPAYVPSEVQRVLTPGGRFLLTIPLLTNRSDCSGNRELRKALLKFCKAMASRRSQGLSVAEIQAELSDFHLETIHEAHVVERFDTLLEMLETLHSRSSLNAIFGEQSDEVFHDLLSRPSDNHPVDLQWRVGVVEAVKR